MILWTWLSSAYAGPWARDLGSVYAKLGAGQFTGRAAFDARALATRTRSLEGYAEVGLGRGLELDVAAAWVSQRADDAVGRGLQDVELLVEAAPVSGETAVALLGGVRLAPYRRGRSPELGPGGADLLVGAGWGRSFGLGWGTLDAVLRHRLGAASSGLRLRTEWGVAASGTGVAATVEVQPAFGRSATTGVEAVAPVPRVLAFGAKGFVAVASGFGLTADAVWLPDVLNDGPGARVGAGLTFER
ncbi:MAG: hypothetical protein KTR31_18830 [Myxococcales bacterium]|nr:hypothetical protein [Myxococcales bacterium]